jgi:hypothetical protein
MVRHNPVAKLPPNSTREIVVDNTYKMIMPPFILETPVGLSRIQEEPMGKQIPSERELVQAINSTNPSLITFPYINEIYGRVIKDMERYGFVNNKKVSNDSIPLISSTFRSYANQKSKYLEALKEHGADADAYVANPDGPKAPTPHMSGRAVDFSLLVPGTQEMKIAPGTDNRKKMWNTKKWKIFNFLLTNIYKAMSLDNEPWHYEFGEISKKNIDKIKDLEKQGYIIGLPRIPDYLLTDTFIDVETARNYNNKNVPMSPYRIEFDTGSADFAFYVANKQKQLGLKADGMCGPNTYAALVQDFNRGGDTPPQLQTLPSLEPTPFDLDKAFEFLKPSKDPMDVVKQTENQIKQTNSELERVANEEARIERERQLEAERKRQAEAQLNLEANALRRQQLEMQAATAEAELKLKQQRELAELAKRKKALQLEQLKLLQKKAEAIHQMDVTKDALLTSLQQSRQAVELSKASQNQKIMSATNLNQGGFKFNMTYALITLALAGGASFYYIKRNKKKNRS